MKKIRGGMEFETGRLPRIDAPPSHLPVGPLRLAVIDRPEVQAGQTVKPGQLLTDPARLSGCYVSPVAGVIDRVEVLNGDEPDARGDSENVASPTYRFPDPSDWLHRKRGYVIHITPDGEEAATSYAVEPPQGMQLSNWLQVLRKLGPWADRDGGVGLLPQLSVAKDRAINTVVLNALDRFPPYPIASGMMRRFAEEAMAGARIICELVGAKQMRCVVNKAAGITSYLRKPAKKHSVELHRIPNVYPLGDATVLARVLDGRRRSIPPRANPAHHGIVMIDAWTATRLGRWAITERFDLARPIVVAWPIADSRMTVSWAWPGAPLVSLDDELVGAIKQHRLVVLGNPLTGRPITTLDGEDDDAQPATVPDDELLITCMGAEAMQSVTPSPCISCGWCAAVCPTALRPAQLFSLCHRPGNMDVVLDQLNWCIDCGLCSHICPSALPLAQTFRQVQYRYGVS